MDKKFKKEVSNRPGGENINFCFSCGSCTATCPISELDDSYNPRLIIKKILLGYKEEVLQSDDLWKCIQCHRCVAHCPQNVKFAYIMQVLRNISIEEGYYPDSMLKDVTALDRSLRQYRTELIKNKKDLKEVISELAGGDEKDG